MHHWPKAATSKEVSQQGLPLIGRLSMTGMNQPRPYEVWD
jgi:hypothetical protein